MKVCGHRVLVKADPIVEETEWGFQVHGSSIEKRREQNAATKGTVVAIGPNAWKAFERKIIRQSDGSDKVVEGPPWAEVGDKVIYSKYGGSYVYIQGEEHTLLNDEDICVVLEGDEAEDIKVTSDKGNE